jgi:hypothetical protein
MIDHPREIRQLWFVANHYFKEAEKLKFEWYKYLDTTLADIMDFFENGTPKEECERELSLLVAHLNSAAIRLCTINERFREDGLGEIIKNYLAGLSGKKEDLKDKGLWNNKGLAEELIRHKEEYLPLMLRDEVGHLEEGKSKTEEKEVIWKARHTAIESLKVIEVFTCMQSAMGVFERKLRNKKFIP